MCLTHQKICCSVCRRLLFIFFWEGYYWLPPAVLYFPANEGGQGLIDLAAKVKAMRLKTVQNLLYPVDFRPWVSFGLALLRTFGGFCFDRHLFLMMGFFNQCKMLCFYAKLLEGF